MEYVSTFQTGRRYQVHHSYIWVAPIAATFAVAFAALLGNARSIVNLVQQIQHGTGWGIGALVAVVLATLVVLYAIIAALHAIAYHFLFFEFGDREFSLYSGFITKRHVHVPYARVQSVNHRASVLQRIFGVCSVSIDTAGGASNKAVRVPYVQLQTAELIRVELFTRKMAAAAGAAVIYDPIRKPAKGSLAGALDSASVRAQAPASPRQLASERRNGGGAQNLLEDALGDVGTWRGAFGGEEAGAEPVSFEFGLANSELLLTGFSHSSAPTLAALLGASGLIIGMIMSIPSAQVTEMVGYGIAGSAIGLAAIFIVVGWVFAVLGICLQYGGFRARRRGSRIEVERGLLQREYSGIDVQRVQSVVVRQSFIRRCMGYCEIALGRIDTASDQGSNSNASKLDRNGLVVHPFVKIDRVDEVLAGLLPEFQDRPKIGDLKPLPPVALRRAILRRCVWYNPMLWLSLCVVAVRQWFAFALSANPQFIGSAQAISEVTAALGAICTICLIICAITIIMRAIGAVLWHRGSGIALNHSYVALRNDGLSTEFDVFPRRKVQCGYTRSNPFQRHAHVTGATVVSAAGVGRTRVRLLDVREEDGEAWLEWLVPRTAKQKGLEE